jgi:hypothetical protein
MIARLSHHSKQYLALLVLGLSGCSTLGTQIAPVGLCSVAAAPAQYSGKIIRVSGIASPGPHYDAAINGVACPSLLFAISPSESVENTASYGVFRKIIFGTYLEREQRAKVDLTARFVWRPNEVPARILVVKVMHSAQLVP